jgi:hypothetical protein
MPTRIGSGGAARAAGIAALLASALLSVGCAHGIDPDAGNGPGDDATAGDGAGDGSQDGARDGAADGARDGGSTGCTGTTCTLPHAAAMCVAGMCMLGPCNAGYADLNHMASDGCECQTGSNASQCAMATDQGMVAAGGTHMVMGVVVGPGMDHWLRVTFAAGGHEHIQFATNPNMSLHFDVVSGCMTNSMYTCMDRPVGSTGLTNWEFYDAPTDAGAPPADAAVDGGRMTPYPTTVYIRVYTTAAATSCSPYTLTLSN